MSIEARDAVVVGSGPNGLAAAIELARAGKSVVVYEAHDSPGGGCRSAELTLEGFVHDVCSAIPAAALASPFFRSVPLEQLGVKMLHPQAPVAHPLDDGSAAVLERSIQVTAEGLGPDGDAYRNLMEPLVTRAHALAAEILGPLRVPRHPFALARFGLKAARSAKGLARRFETDHARALHAGIAAHAMMPLDKTPTAAFGLMLGMIAHAFGWPVVQGGTQRLVDGLVEYLEALGGEVICGTRIDSMEQLPPARAYVFDLTPRAVVSMAGDRLPSTYKKRLGRFRYGPGVFKIDLAIDGPIPWKADDVNRAGTVHLGGTFEEIAASERTVTRGGHPERPYVLLTQQSLFDQTRAPAGKHTVWAYCHVPAGSTVDMSERIEAQIERFAPGFRDLVLARHTMNAADYETYNANYIGGDINAGIQDLRQLWTRPVPRLNPYTTPDKSIFICSSSTPPGGGVHGMCGAFAARAALRRAFS